jgi:hypothetical protein
MMVRDLLDINKMENIKATNNIISAYRDLKYTVQSVVFDSLKAIEIQKLNNKEIPIVEVSSGSISNLLEKRKL